ncbi:MAG: triose-phosphate isomerase [Anaerolineales bacterium]|jgi:triosephosphate isomerase
MARKPFVAANWKMHKTVAEAVLFIDDFVPRVGNIKRVDIILCPPFTSLPVMREKLENSLIQLGAQNMHWEPEGAYTGEISALMLLGLCDYVIIGHSERRAYFDETDEIVNKKLVASFNNGLRPILCVGESLDQREAGETHEFVSGQVKAALNGFSAEELSRMVIAYEPIWAIGTGKAATPDDADEVINQTIRNTLTELFDPSTADAMRILYGGSVKPGNAKTFFDIEGIDGALVGGASLKPDSFSAIVEAAL